MDRWMDGWVDGQAGTWEPIGFLRKLQTGGGMCVNGRWDLGERKDRRSHPWGPSEPRCLLAARLTSCSCTGRS